MNEEVKTIKYQEFLAPREIRAVAVLKHW